MGTETVKARGHDSTGKTVVKGKGLNSELSPEAT